MRMTDKNLSLLPPPPPPLLFLRMAQWLHLGRLFLHIFTAKTRGIFW